MVRRFAVMSILLLTTLHGDRAAATVADSTAGFGCCQQTVDLTMFGGGVERRCSVVFSDQCVDAAAVFGSTFLRGYICNPAGECVDFSPPDIVTSASLARTADDCFTPGARPVLIVGQDSDVTVCAALCNFTGVNITRVTLNIDPLAVPFFNNTAASLPDGACAAVKQPFSAAVIRKNIGLAKYLDIANMWCASSVTIPMGSCAPLWAEEPSGTSAGPVPIVFTDTQHALLLIGPTQGAPALDRWGLDLLAAALVAIGVLRLARSARRRA